MDARTSLQAVTAWIEANVAPIGTEPVFLTEAVGRIAAQDVAAPAPLPAHDRAARDGIAMRAVETVGASAYNPLTFRLAEDLGLSPGGARQVAAGDRLPDGADTVIARDQVEIDDGSCTIVEPADPGAGVERAGAHAAAGTTLVAAGRRIGAVAAGALAASDIRSILVASRPRVRVLPARDGAADRALLDALIDRDGGSVDPSMVTCRTRAALVAALRGPYADLVIVVGGTGPGVDDHAAAALAEAGTLAIHGVAIRQCETAGLGSVPPGQPVVLLPGAPASCLWAYELIAGPVLRRLGRRPIGLPYERRRMTTARKIASSIGMTDVCPVVRNADDRVEPIAPFSEGGLGVALRADGFVIVAEGSEGYARDSEVMVYLFDR